MPQLTIRRPFGELDLCDEPETGIHIGLMNRTLAVGAAPKVWSHEAVNSAVRLLSSFDHSIRPVQHWTAGSSNLPDDFGALMARVPVKSALPRGPYAKTSAPR